MNSYRRTIASEHLVLHLLLLLGGVSTLTPFLWMLATSVKPASEALSATPSLLPRTWQWSNYAEALTAVPFTIFYVNTVVVTVARVIGQLLTASLAAYAFARLRFPGRELLFLLVLSVGIAYFQGQFTTDYGAMMAAATLATLPILLLFSLAQRQLIEGITLSTLKG